MYLSPHKTNREHNMYKYFYILLLLFSLSACKNTENASDYELYTYLKVCFEDYYLNYDVEVSTLLDKFEVLLLEEGHLVDTTGQSYKLLFKSLDQSDYFNPPLKKEDFNNVLLYKNPSNILECAITVFSLDSVEIVNTQFSKIAREISEKTTQEEDVSIHYFFDLYQNKLTNEEIKMPYVKQSILLLLYRWYFKSKYDREIQIKESARALKE